MTTEVATIRLPRGSLDQLKRMSHELSLQRRKDVSWADIVRAAIANILNNQHQEKGK